MHLNVVARSSSLAMRTWDEGGRWGVVAVVAAVVVVVMKGGGGGEG